MNTGWKKYKNLIEVYTDNGKPTGNVKLNVETDENYVSDVWNPDVCPFPGYDPNAIVGNIIDLPEVFTLTAGIVNNIGGTISISPYSSAGNYLEGTIVTITAIESVGYDFQEFQNVQAMGGTVNMNVLTLTMDSNKTIYANYIPEKRKITVLPGTGFVNVAPLGLLNAGDYSVDYNTVLTFVNQSVVVNGIYHGANYQFHITSDIKINKFFGSLYVTF